MGYSTQYIGAFILPNTLTMAEFKIIDAMLGEDVRHHPEWNYNGNLYYIDLELSNNYSMIEFNGAEKSGDLEDALNLILQEVRKISPDFEYVGGSMHFQGEDIRDVGVLQYDPEQRKVVRLDTDTSCFKTVECPHCGEEFLT